MADEPAQAILASYVSHNYMAVKLNNAGDDAERVSQPPDG